MREWTGDIWDRFMRSFIVVPTNIGYKTNRDGKVGPNVMGRGVAAQAADRVPELPQIYGEYCARFGADTNVTLDLTTGLVLFPTKPLNPDNPSLSWKGKSSLKLVERSARDLASMSWMTRARVRDYADSRNRPAFGDEAEDDAVYLPLVGCGSGGLREDDVIPLLASILTDDRFVLVQYRPF